MAIPLPAQRHRRILEVLQERHVARVSALSALLGVSEVTVRRDLEALERRGLLERTHGGAVHAHRMRGEPRYIEAMSSHADEKRVIGRAAASFVEPGDTIFLNGGTTTLEVFRHLSTPGLRIITNHIGIALEAADRDLELVLLGGHYRSPSNSVVGPLASAALRSVNATRAFLGVEGISLRSGVTTPSEYEAEVAKLMAERTRGDVFLVADHSKLGTVADFVIFGVDHADALVVDPGIEEEYREGLREMGVEVIVAEASAAVPAERA